MADSSRDEKKNILSIGASQSRPPGASLSCCLVHLVLQLYSWNTVLGLHRQLSTENFSPTLCYCLSVSNDPPKVRVRRIPRRQSSFFGLGVHVSIRMVAAFGRVSASLCHASQ